MSRPAPPIVPTQFQINDVDGHRDLCLTSEDGTNRLTLELVRKLADAVLDMSTDAKPLIIHGKRKILLGRCRPLRNTNVERIVCIRLCQSGSTTDERSRPVPRARLCCHPRILHGRWTRPGPGLSPPDCSTQCGVRAPWRRARSRHRLGWHAAIASPRREKPRFGDVRRSRKTSRTAGSKHRLGGCDCRRSGGRSVASNRASLGTSPLRCQSHELRTFQLPERCSRRLRLRAPLV